jgi:hypothetical protein
MDEIVHMRLLFVVALVVMAAVLTLLACGVEWLASRRMARRQGSVSRIRTTARDVAVGRAR